MLGFLFKMLLFIITMMIFIGAGMFVYRFLPFFIMLAFMIVVVVAMIKANSLSKA